VADLVDGLHANARAIADGIAEIPGAEILNDVVYTQVSVAFGVGRAHHRGHRPVAGVRRGVDVRLAVAGPRGAARLGVELVDRRGGRGRVGGCRPRRRQRDPLTVRSFATWFTDTPVLRRRVA
jgi:hypothetical protein